MAEIGFQYAFDSAWVPPSESKRFTSDEVRTDGEKFSFNTLSNAEIESHCAALSVVDRIVHVVVVATSIQFSAVMLARDLGGNFPARVHFAVYDPNTRDFIQVICDKPEVSVKYDRTLTFRFTVCQPSVPLVWDRRLAAVYVECHPAFMTPYERDYGDWILGRAGFGRRVPLCSLSRRKSRGQQRLGRQLCPLGYPVGACLAPRGWVFSFGCLAGVGFAKPTPELAHMASTFFKLVHVKDQPLNLVAASAYAGMFGVTGIPPGSKMNAWVIAYYLGMSFDDNDRGVIKSNAWGAWWCEIVAKHCKDAFLIYPPEVSGGSPKKVLDENNDEVDAFLCRDEFRLVDVLMTGADKESLLLANGKCVGQDILHPGADEDDNGQGYYIQLPSAWCDHARGCRS